MNEMTHDVLKVRFCGSGRSKPFYIDSKDYASAVNNMTTLMVYFFGNDSAYPSALPAMKSNLMHYQQLGFRSLDRSEYTYGGRNAIRSKVKKYWHGSTPTSLARTCKKLGIDYSKAFYMQYKNRNSLLDEGYEELSYIKLMNRLVLPIKNAGYHLKTTEEFEQELLHKIVSPMIHNTLKEFGEKGINVEFFRFVETADSESEPGYLNEITPDAFLFEYHDSGIWKIENRRSPWKNPYVVNVMIGICKENSVERPELVEPNDFVNIFSDLLMDKEKSIAVIIETKVNPGYYANLISGHIGSRFGGAIFEAMRNGIFPYYM